MKNRKQRGVAEGGIIIIFVLIGAISAFISSVNDSKHPDGTQIISAEPQKK